MKRFATVAALLLSLVMLFTLAACGDKPEETQPTEPATQTETTEPADTTTEPAAAGVDLAALQAQILADCQVTDSVDVPADRLETVYGIAADQVVASAAFNATGAGAFPEEGVMVQAVDETAAADIAAKLQSHLDGIAEQAASYDPDGLALAQACTVETKGAYVAMFFAQQHEAMNAAFQSAVG